jgi:hypothetical protein
LDELSVTITDIRQFTQVPNYPAGMRRLQSCQARVATVKKRIGAIGPRLSRLAMVVKQQGQNRRQTEGARQVTELAPTDPPAVETDTTPAEDRPGGEEEPLPAEEAAPDATE